MSDMSARRCRTLNSMEQACILCCRAEADPDICGPKLSCQWLTAHQFCMLFATDLRPHGTEHEEQRAYFSLDIQHTVDQAAQMVCFVCGEKGATIACQEMGCDRRFHLPCAVEGGCVTRYVLPYSSFCWEHRPQQQELVAPENTTCVICMDPVEDRTTYETMVCPACKRAWFHRTCMQGQALCSGAFSLQCPLCQNTRLFLTEMLFVGIRIPERQASWEDDDAYRELYQRHRSCDASKCLCPGGRRVAEPEGPWQLFLCSSCAAVGTHRRCSKLGRSRKARWECDICAGPGTSSSSSSELAGPITAGQAASGQTRRCSTTRQQPSAACRGSEPRQRSRSNRAGGPMQLQDRSRLQRRDQAPYARPRRCSQGSRTPAARAERSPRTHAASRLSQASGARVSRSRSTTRQWPSASFCGSRARKRGSASRSTGPVRVRDRSRSQHRAQTANAQPGHLSGTNRVPSVSDHCDPPLLA